ncbi:MAG: hypothetical protein E7317_02185 [Clostridiales bacterium]|nr:hypothetical protein [Clostridiales bacterium]
MLDTAIAFMAECDRAQIKYHNTREIDNGSSLVVCGFTGKQNNRYDVAVIFDANEKSAGLRIFKLAVASEEKREEVLKAINDINNTFRWTKFTLHDDGDINVEIDALINQETVGRVMVELMLRMAKIVDDAYPQLMHALWG